jgi:small conductance mechanosensitive channel
MDININQALSEVYQTVNEWVMIFFAMIPNLLIATIVFILFYVIARWVRGWASKPFGRILDSKTIIELLLNVLFVAIVLLGFFIALSILKLTGAVTSLLAGAGIIGLALGFAFQDIAANFIAGVLMAFRKPLEVGDVIQSNDHLGVCYHINLRNTVIKTFQGQLVHIPNKDIFSKPLKNFSTEQQRRVDLECGVSYGDDLKKVRKLVLDAIASIEYIDHAKGISFYYTKFDDSSINFQVRYWIEFHKQPDFMLAQSDGIMKIKEAFDENDVTIPFPIRTLDFGIKGGERLVEQMSMLNGKEK